MLNKILQMVNRSFALTMLLAVFLTGGASFQVQAMPQSDGHFPAARETWFELCAPEGNGHLPGCAGGLLGGGLDRAAGGGGVTSGCSVTPMLYCPTTPVSRDQMAVFLIRNFGFP